MDDKVLIMICLAIVIIVTVNAFEPFFPEWIRNAKKALSEMFHGDTGGDGYLKDENGFSIAPKAGDDQPLNEKIALICTKVRPLPQEFSFSASEIDLLRRQHYDHGSVRYLTGLALGHLGLDSKHYSVNVTYDAEGSEGRAGTYSTNGYLKSINIILQNNLEEEQVLATICHECTHAYLFDRNIKMEPESENERLTDCAAIMLGFGKVMEMGYQRYLHSGAGNTRVMSKVGYLELNQIRYVMTERKNILLQKELAEQKKAYIDGIGKGLEQLDEVLKRYEYVVKEISEDKTAKPSEEDFRLLSEGIFNISSGHYRNQKSCLEAQFRRAVKKTEYEEIKQKTEALGKELAEISAKLGKYL